MTPIGKIARLPEDIRQEINHRIMDGQSGPRILSWLNNLPAVREALVRDFGGRPVNHQNLSAWRAGGYREWNFRREIIMNAIELQSQSAEAGFSRKSDCRKVMQGLKEISGLHMNA